MSLSLLLPRAAPTTLASSPRRGGETNKPALLHRRLRRGVAVVPRASSSSDSSSSSSSPDREPLSPSSSPLDFRPVFALSPPRGQPTLQDAQDALETCDALSGQGRASCFASFGIDSERVDAWYGPVSRLEAALNNSSHAGAGLCSFGDETEEEEEEEDFDGGDDGGDEGGGGFRWPSLPGMPRW